MIIVGWPNCDSCKILKQKYPDLEYFEIPQKAIYLQAWKIKRLMGEYKITYFPVIINNTATEVIPMSTFDPAFAKEHPKLY